MNYSSEEAALAIEALRREAISYLQELQKSGDIEAAHSEADGVLCKLLTKLGYSDVVDEWLKIDKWYA